jgi:hypothetical protein
MDAVTGSVRGERMTDLISRQAAIDAIENTPFDDYGDYMLAMKLIEELPSAEPKDTTEEVRKQLKDMEQRREMDRKK